MKKRVQQIIAQSGLCSRRKAEELIEDGKVSVNGVVITIGDKAEEKDTILVEGQEIKKEPQAYYMLNKPARYITTSDDMFGREKVLDLVPRKPRVFAVGRLDRDATGLLLLTNDGTFANKVMHPSNGIGKTYIAILDEPFKKSDIDKAKKGLYLDRTTVKAQIVQLDKNIVAITVHVGIHKVVKRICKELGYMVKHLHRTHIGNLAVDIEDGEWRKLSSEDMKKIFSKEEITKKTFIEQ